ncbi:glycosyltransferase family 4 protein [Deinococcus sp. Leaf326]|uniref:glycosyltransferase family 4 protein n=1 Tax=Deinococcus sp. Leaf326 TaxID=1736338 RepID=UPI0006F69322|nr:glycosyltransferase family 4 protein [Deinococcus sp. Leaf326]KQQ97819.1 hypothetical protein ASF71_14450 [Deinococcus sp. Leaf326]
MPRKPERPPGARPHILLLITKAERGGAQTHVLELMRLRDRARITVASGEDGFLLEQARALGLETVVVPQLVAPLDPRRDLAALWALTRLLRRLRPDLVHLHSSKAGLLGRVAARLAGVPAVFTAHGWAFTEGAGRARRLLAIWSERLAAPLSAAIIAVSDYDRDLGARLRVAPQARTIHNALPGEPRPGLATARPAGPVRFVMVARFAPPKDQGLLLRAAAPLRGAEVWLIGDGPELETTRALAATLEMGERARFLGSRDDVPELLAQGDVFCLCSHYEGFPISVLEGMRAGLPVIASDVGGVGEAVVDGRTGLLVAHNDVVSWRLALARLLDDPAGRAAMGHAGGERFAAHFTLPHLLERTWAVYREVLARRR